MNVIEYLDISIESSVLGLVPNLNNSEIWTDAQKHAHVTL
jgi:hypothetical protein